MQTAYDGIPADLGEVVIFDRDCVLCSQFAQFMTRHDRTARFRFVMARSPLGEAIYDRYSIDRSVRHEIVVISNGEACSGLDGIELAASKIGWPWAGLAVLKRLSKPLAVRAIERIAGRPDAMARRDCICHLAVTPCYVRVVEKSGVAEQ
jgi:predicted DCC family thiol-disulfide oxidoreductase YuxK